MITTWSKGIADDFMSEDMLTELTDIVGKHPWFHARMNLLLELLRTLNVHPPARVLDAGCGWGVTLERLERAGYQAAGLDISERMLRRLDRPGRTLIEADLGKSLPPDGEQFDVVLALDVIEHLDDDHSAVKTLAQLTKPGGFTVVSVPALPELFSEFDRVQGHRRRYVPETLRRAFADTELVIEKLFWWGAWLVPLLRRQRKQTYGQPGMTAAEIYRRYLALPSWPLALGLRVAFGIDQYLTLRGKAKTGTSLFAVARHVG